MGASREVQRRDAKGDARVRHGGGRKGSKGGKEKPAACARQRRRDVGPRSVKRGGMRGGAPVVGRCHSTESPLCPRGSLTPVAQSAWLDFPRVFRRFRRADTSSAVGRWCALSVVLVVRSRLIGPEYSQRRAFIWRRERKRDARCSEPNLQKTEMSRGIALRSFAAAITRR